MLQTTSRCNAACAFCPYPSVSETLSHGTMEEELYRRIIDECAEHPGEVQRILPYLMNEPLLDGRIVERVDYAKRRCPQASVHLLTNGSLLTARRGDALIDSGLDWIGISVHGFSEAAYQAAMGLSREGTYRRVDRFIERAIARRGADFVMVTFNGGGPVTAEEREAELDHFRALGVERISYFGRSISRAGNVPAIAAPSHTRLAGCRSIWWPEMIHVLHNGDVVLCCMDWRREVVLGNLGGRSINELWRSEPYRRVRDLVWGRAAGDPCELPCSRCEEAIVEPLAPEKTVDVALVVLPCAVMDSDASTVPGIQYALRALGVEETLEDLSAQVYGRMDDRLTYLWRRAGHGVVHHGDPSADLMQAVPDEVEWCTSRAREIDASHLLFPLLRTTHGFTVEVVRRIRERDPGRSVLVYGTEERQPGALSRLGVPYLRYSSRQEVASWLARRAGIEAPGPPERRDDPPGQPEAEAARAAASPAPVQPPWRPPGWEGTGAGMAAPIPGEQAPGIIGQWVAGLRELSATLRGGWRRPLTAGRELRSQLGQLGGALAHAVRPVQTDAPPPTTGVPGSMKLDPLPVTRIMRGGNVPAPEVADEQPEPSRPAPPEEPEPEPLQEPAPEPYGPWQRRPDHGKPIDVLLGTLPPWGFNNPPVGLAHLSTYARSRGYHVEMLDLNIDLYRRLGPEWELLWHVENKNYWSNDATFDLLLDLLGPHLDRYAQIIADHPAPLVGLSVVDPKERCTIELVRRIKALDPGKRVLLGGPACVTPEYRRIFLERLPGLVDGYALGEGEGILCDVIEALRDGAADLSRVSGVLCEEVEVRSRRPHEALDDYPFPRYEDFDFSRYASDELIVEWSRGCTGSCTFCKGKMIDGRYRSHSAAAIFAALERYASELGIRKLTVCDPVLNGDPEVLEELCRLIHEAGLDLEWRGEAIPHPGLTAELLRSMRAAGCVELQLGVESGSDRVLELMNKRRLFSAAEAARVVRDCHDAGIRTALFVIVGFPGEGEQEFLETYRFVADNADHIDELKSINSLHIITGTPVHLQPERYNLCLPDQDYHYRWSTADGENTTEVRNERIRRLQRLAAEHDIFVRETNLAEGKHRDLEQARRDGRSREELLAMLHEQVVALRSV
jgi:radical SAM superfamily enzyme YgiQ (UPF0313 family)/MoaA/NifB/PqqE/SkfB family radical SAM enzyme